MRGRTTGGWATRRVARGPLASLFLHLCMQTVLLHIIPHSRVVLWGVACPAAVLPCTQTPPYLCLPLVSALAPLPAFLLSHLCLFSVSRFPLPFLAVLRFLLSISPRLCLHRAIRSEHFFVHVLYESQMTRADIMLISARDH